MVLVTVLAVYVVVLLFVSRWASAKGTDDAFFRGERKSPWYLVAFGMVGASISGVTFVSVPGMVLQGQMTYLQTCMGFILGYFAIAFVLLPIYYKLRLTSIYSFLNTVNSEAYKTGASIFILSKLMSSAAKFFVPCYIISTALDTNFYLTAVVLYAVIWLYTRNGGIKALVWTDTLQTLCMLAALLLIIYNVYAEFGYADVHECFAAVSESSYSKVFQFNDWGSADNFVKSFVSGIFIVIVMTGLDQDMMQKNLTCRTLADARKDMCTYGFAFLPVNALFLVLGVMLVLLRLKQGQPLPDAPDALLTSFALNGNAGMAVLAFFTIGIVATSFSTVDSALTALTTSFCVDISPRPRRTVHAAMAVVMILCTMLFRLLNTTSLINAIYTMVSYTYGPLLGLFAYALLHRKGHGEPVRTRKGGVAMVCIMAPLLCFACDVLMPRFTGYHFGYEILLLNGMLTYLGLHMVRVKGA